MNTLSVCIAVCIGVFCNMKFSFVKFCSIPTIDATGSFFCIFPKAVQWPTDSKWLSFHLHRLSSGCSFIFSKFIFQFMKGFSRNYFCLQGFTIPMARIFLRTLWQLKNETSRSDHYKFSTMTKLNQAKCGNKTLHLILRWVYCACPLNLHCIYSVYALEHVTGMDSLDDIWWYCIPNKILGLSH